MLFKIKSLFFLFLSVLTLSGLQVKSQCLTDFGKILPDTTLATLQEYGSSVAIYGDYVAIGSLSKDSVRYNGGMVFIYQKVDNSYQKVATILSGISSMLRRPVVTISQPGVSRLQAVRHLIGKPAISSGT